LGRGIGICAGDFHEIVFWVGLLKLSRGITLCLISMKIETHPTGEVEKGSG